MLCTLWFIMQQNRLKLFKRLYMNLYCTSIFFSKQQTPKVKFSHSIEVYTHDDFLKRNTFPYWTAVLKLMRFAIFLKRPILFINESLIFNLHAAKNR